MSRIQKTALPNGINVITEEMPDVESASIGIWVNTGSRHEEPSVGGISHFIEHLLFKGTETRSALDISKEIESVGGMLNAFTSRESTCFYAKVLNKDLPLAIDLLADMFLRSKFDPSEMEKERQVVLQEIKMVEDTPDDLIHDLFAERFWKGASLGRSILGTTATVGAIKRGDVAAYFNEHYRSRDVFITAAGGLRHAKVERLLRRQFKGLKTAQRRRDASAPLAASGVKLIKRDLEQAHLCLGVPVPPQPHPDRYKVYLINTMLGAGMSSRLFQEIREKRGLAYSVYTYLNLCRDAGSLVAYAGTSKASFAEVVRLILKEYEKLRRGAVTKDELGMVKEQLKGGMLLGLETSEARMTKLARDEMYFGKEVPVKELVRGIDRVTVREITETAARLLRRDNITLVAMGKVSAKGLPAGLKG